MNDDKLKINPPLYTIGQKISYWRCESRMPVIALLAPNIDDAEGQVCILSDIDDIPQKVLSFIQSKVPIFKLKNSKMAEKNILQILAPNAECCMEIFFCILNQALRFFHQMGKRQKLSI
ncbi:MAG: hypothetical protein K8R58_04715 [Bacteroidales bacterium]|nr:hypothetical protein [Bacteroidales bacterium]